MQTRGDRPFDGSLVLSTTAVIPALLEDAARLDIRAIDWLGGDPLERPDWADLMAYARSLGRTNDVWTSGLPLRAADVARMVTDLTEGGFVSVHVDSVFPETYARLHRWGNPQNIAMVVEGVDNMLAAGKSPDQMINCITYTSLQPPEDAIETMRWWPSEKGLVMWRDASAAAQVGRGQIIARKPA